MGRTRSRHITSASCAEPLRAPTVQCVPKQYLNRNTAVHISFNSHKNSHPHCTITIAIRFKKYYKLFVSDLEMIACFVKLLHTSIYTFSKLLEHLKGVFTSRMFGVVRSNSLVSSV